MSLILPRRRFLVGLASSLAAPAIVHAANLMPVRAFDYDAVVVGNGPAREFEWSLATYEPRTVNLATAKRARTVREALGLVRNGGTIVVRAGHVEEVGGPMQFPPGELMTVLTGENNPTESPFRDTNNVARLLFTPDEPVCWIEGGVSMTSFMVFEQKSS